MATRLPEAPKVGMVSLGCPKNLVDSERILTKLRSDGYAMSADYAGADVVLVNTCGFLDSAKRRVARGDRPGHVREWQGDRDRLHGRHAGPDPREASERARNHRTAGL
jgi:hypothetical protein